jgi:hypothetical protein
LSLCRLLKSQAGELWWLNGSGELEIDVTQKARALYTGLEERAVKEWVCDEILPDLPILLEWRAANAVVKVVPQYAVDASMFVM